jgi:hypothetical protein
MRTAKERGEVVVGGEIAVVDKVLAGILGVVGPRVKDGPICRNIAKLMNSLDTTKYAAS